MKALGFILLFLSASNFAYSQTFCKEVCAYGFQRSELPGMIADLDNASDPSKADTSYFIYLESPAELKLSTAEIWIKGEGFFVEKMLLEKTPVLNNFSRTQSDVSSDTLIHETKKAVHRLFKGKPIGRPAYARFQATIRSNDVVIFYKVDSSHYFTSLSKLTLLEPIAFQ